MRRSSFGFMCFVTVLETTAAVLFFFVPLCHAQQKIDPQQQPMWYTSGQKWGPWTSFSQYPFLSVRGACGDDTTVSGVPMFSLWTQIRNNSAYPMAVVWAEEMYNKATGKNIVSGSFLEYLDPGQITEAWTTLGGNCGATHTFYAQIKCAARKGNEGAACFKNSHGDLIAERTDQFRAPSAQSSGAEGASREATSQGSVANSAWACTFHFTDMYFAEFYPSPTDTQKIAFGPDGSTHVVLEEDGRTLNAGRWQQNTAEVDWTTKHAAYTGLSRVSISGNSMAGEEVQTDTYGGTPHKVGTYSCTRE